jgi:hypothetical protein
MIDDSTFRPATRGAFLLQVFGSGVETHRGVPLSRVSQVIRPALAAA